MKVIEEEEEDALIPGLKDSLTLLCLARVPRANYPAMRRVSKLWQITLLSKRLYHLRSRLGVEEPWIYVPFCSIQQRARNFLQAYDPKANLWHNITVLPGMSYGEVLKDFALVSVEERLFVIGGRVCSTKGSAYQDLYLSKEVRVFNCITGKWSQCSSMSLPRVDFACTVCNGLIFVAGGRSELRYERGVCRAEVYIPQQNAWRSLPDMSICRFKCVGVSLDSKIFVVGGFASSQVKEEDMIYSLDRSSVEVYDMSSPAPAMWSLVRTMWQLDVPPNQILTVEGMLYSSGDVLNAWKGRVERYDQRLNLWKIVEGSQRLQPISKAEISYWDAQKWQPSYLTMALVGKSSLFFVGGYKTLAETVTDECEGVDDDFGECSSPSSGGSNRKRNRDEDLERRVTGNGRLMLEVVSVFETEGKKWTSFEHLSTSRKELCSHCCTVAL